MIYHVSPSYPPALGGLEKVVETLAVSQNDMGINVTVLTSLSGGENKKNSRSKGFEVQRLRYINFANTLIMPGLPVKLLKVRKHDLVHLHITQAYSPEIVWMTSRLKGYKYIAHIHLDIPRSGKLGFLLSFYKKNILKKVLNSAKFVVVFTKEQKLEVQRKYGVAAKKIKVIPNGVEDKFYYSKERKLHKKPRILFVGRLNFQKNLEYLLLALKDVSERFETNIIGDGELKKELEDLAKKLKLSTVIFPGRIEGEQLVEYFKRSDIFVLPSRVEGMPLVLLEAMAMGMPSIVTDVVGNRDIIENNVNGVVVPVENPYKLRAALLNLSSDLQAYERMSRNANEIAKSYSWRVISKMFVELYGEAK